MSPIVYSRPRLLLCPPELIEGPNTLLEPLFPGYPELFAVLHDISKDGTTEEYHVLASRRIFNAYFEFLPSQLR